MKLTRSTRPSAAAATKRRVSWRTVPKRTVMVTFRRPQSFKHAIGLIAEWLQRLLRTRWRVGLVLTIALLLFTEILPILQPMTSAKNFALEDTAKLLTPANKSLAKKIRFDSKQQSYEFNEGYNPRIEGIAGAGGANISASASINPEEGITVTDATNDVDFGLKPLFNLQKGRQQDNRIYYPLTDGTGWLVYSLEAGQVKEDVLLSRSNGDTMTLKYELELGNNLEARLDKRGNINVYGTSLPLNGNVSTGNEKDAKLLQKARQQAKKDKVLFTIQAPVVNEPNKTKSSVNVGYELDGKNLTVNVAGLRKASYPLAIDPSIYVNSAQQFMQGNNESNIDFNVPSDLIQKGALTGARIPSWASTMSLNTSISNHGTSVGGGYAYVVGGNNGTTNLSSVYWAKFNTNDDTVISPNPGNGACTNFCTNSAYDLPVNRAGLTTFVYNGYLYAVGGTDTTDPACANTGNVCSTVYYSKIGANGEPNTWKLATNSLPTGVKYTGAVAYNNRVYVVGGQSSAASGGEQLVQSAAMNPDGNISAWTNYTSIPTAGRWGHTLLQTNGYLYLVGGANGTTTQNTVQYIKINADGTLASSWVGSTAFTTARATVGGNFATIYGGYLYIAGGCSTVTATNCTTVLSDLQLASINGDGSVTNWAQQTGITQARSNYGFTAWRGALYAIGGCTSTACSPPSTAVTYGSINNDGDISVRISTPGFVSTTATSSNCLVPADTNTNCDLPPAGNGTGQAGRLASGVVINNGYLYNIGGCLQNDCTVMSSRTAFTSISANGSMVSPATCAGVRVNNWCVDAVQLNGTTGLGAFGITVFNNTIYAYGGSTGGGFQTSIFSNNTTVTGALGATWSTVTTASSGLPTTARASSFIFSRATSSVTTNTFAGNLYIAGGCTGTSGISCTGYNTEVYKCNILATGLIYSGATTASRCTTTGQLQIDGDPDTAGSQGLGISAGTVYGNYVYLAGGASGSTTTTAQQRYVFYAKIDGTNNIVDPTSGHTSWPYTTTDSAGTGTTASLMTTPRRRGTAYATNGYLYVIAGHDGTAGSPGDTLQDVQLGKIDLSTGNILSYTELKDNAGSGNIITKRWNLASAGANGYIYMIGGCTGGNVSSTPPGNCRGVSNSGTDAQGMSGIAEYVQVYNNFSGSPASYGVQSTGTLPTDRTDAGTVVKDGYIYVAGGCITPNNVDCGNVGGATTDVSYAPINADGTITSNWIAAPALVQDRSAGCLVALSNTLYYIAGQRGSSGGNDSSNTVYYSTITNGVPSAWTSGTAIPLAITGASCTTFNGRVYITGGHTGPGTAASSLSTVYVSASTPNGGPIASWTTTTAFTRARYGHATIAYGNNLYVIGGYDGTNYMSDVQYALINTDGTVGSWSNATSLPQLVRQASGFGANGYLYIFGGRSAATTCTSNTYIAPVNANPIVGKVVQANISPLGAWSQTSVAFSGARYGAAAAYDGGRAYLVGGSCNSVLVGANRISYGTLQSQPQIATYSLKIDADTDVFPSKFLMNGVDNGVGARWLFRYQSSQAATNSWGQSTNFGALTLGTPGTYTSLDSIGTDVLSARYYYLVVTVDASQTFGFPEDSTRGPTIDDIMLQFSSDPGKRLRNGKTFTDGVQQPIDTPF